MSGLRPLLLSAPLAFCVSTAIAEENTYPINIPAQSLATALDSLAQQTAIKPFFNDSLVAGKQSPAVSGRLSPRQALERLLSGSGLTYQFNDNQAVAITRQDSSDAVNSLPAVKVVGKAEYDVTDPYNEDYVLPNATAGTKTDTPIMETPLNVQVVSKQVMKDQQVITLGDALKNVSGVSVAAQANNRGDFSYNSGTATDITLRGLASQTFFRDGFRLQQGAGSRNMSNIEAVEVLKGPAAILYGLVEPGGMVNVITKQPLATPYYALGQQFGSYDNYRTTIDATGPIAGNTDVLYRMNASYQNSGSWQDFSGIEDFFVAPVLKWIISPKTQISVEFEYNRQHQVPTSSFNPFINGQLFKLPLSTNYSEPSPTTTETFFGSLNWSHQFNDDWSIKHRFSANQQGFSGNNFSTPLGVYAPADFPLGQPGIDVIRESVSSIWQNNTYATNLDLIGHFDTVGLKHTLLLGGDYYRINNTSKLSLDGNIFSYIDPYHPAHPGITLPFSTSYNMGSQQQTDQYGLYFQDQIKLPFDVHVTGGLRYQYLHQNSVDLSLGIPGNPSILTQDAVTPRVGILWHPQNWLSLYANYTENFGPNLIGGLVYQGPATSPTPIAPTSATQYEGGIKTEFFDGRLRATLAYFDLTKTNYAVLDPQHLTECAGLQCWLSIGAVRSRGPELDIQGEILPGWNAIATWANTDVRITKSNANNDPIPFSNLKVGDRLPYVARNTASFWSTYELQDTLLKGLKFGGGVTVREGLIGPGYSNVIKTPGYATLGLMTAYNHVVGKSKITLQLNVDNLLDQRYFTSISGSPNGAWAPYGAPRTVLGSINIQY